MICFHRFWFIDLDVKTKHEHVTEHVSKGVKISEDQFQEIWKCLLINLEAIVMHDSVTLNIIYESHMTD